MVVFLNSALGVDFSSLHKILRTLYEKMMPLCSDVASFAAALAALGALFYIGYRVWGSLARAEPLDVFRLVAALYDRVVHSLFSTGGYWVAQRYSQPAGCRDQPYAAGASDGYERVAEEEGPVEMGE